MQDHTLGRGDRRRIAAALVILVLVAFSQRAWMGSVRLDSGRFWDEQFAVGNTVHVLESGSLAPANAFHPSLAHLPQTALLAGVRGLCAHTVACDDPVVVDGGLTPLGYLLARWLQAAFGAASLVLVFVVGRRLFGPVEGLLAAAVLAMAPWHVRQSAIFKPDVLLLLLTVAALAAALWVAQRPTLRRYALAGTVVGLAASAKYIGLTAGFLLLPGTLAGLRRKPRRLWWLAVAAATAVATFAVLNPHLVLEPERVVRDFSRTLRDYRWKGTRAGTSGLDLFVHAAATLLSPSFHGPLLGAAGLAGLLLLGASALAGRGDRRQREGRLTLAAFPLLYALCYAAATTNPSPHNWLPLAPFTSLGAAWLTVAAARVLGRGAARRLPRAVARLPARATVAALLAACVLLSLGLSFNYTYFATVPTTYTLAQNLVVRDLRPDLKGRVVVYDPWRVQKPVVRLGRGNKATTVPRSPLEDSPAALHRADAVILRRDLGEPPTLSAGGRVRRIEPRLFRTWGPPLTIVTHPWKRLGAVGEAASTPPPPDTHLSLLVTRRPPASAAELKVRLAGQPMELHWVWQRGQVHHYASLRVPAPAGPELPELELESGGRPGRADVRVVAWRPPRPSR